MPDDDSIDDSLPFRYQDHTDEELAEYDHGLEAGGAGKPDDDTKTPAWRRGWADAHE